MMDVAGGDDDTVSMVGDLLGADPESTEDLATDRRRRRWGRFAVQLSVALLALLVFGAAGVLWHLTNSVTGSVHTVAIAGLPATQTNPAGSPMTVLLIGSDLRTGTDAEDGVSGQRADAIMLIRFSADRQRIDVMSIPRDSWVQIPGHGTTKINASLNPALGGSPSLVAQTVEQLTDIPINHVMVMDFDGVRDLTTALGGVTVINDKQGTDPRTGTHFNLGPITLSGDMALTFVRQRYGLSGGDFDRIDHEQELVAAIGDKLKKTNLVGSPLLIEHVVQIVADNLTVDAGMTPALMTQMLVDIVSMPQSGVHFYTAPSNGGGTASDGEEYVTLDMAKLAAACLAMRTDKPIPLTGTSIKLP